MLLKIGSVPYVDTDEATPSNRAGKSRAVMLRRVGAKWRVEIEGVSQGELPLVELSHTPSKQLHRLIRRRKGSMYKTPKLVSVTDRSPGIHLVRRDPLNPPLDRNKPRM